MADVETKGLADLRQLVRSGLPDGGVATTFGLELKAVEAGSTMLEAEAGPHMFNHYGTVHGGFAAAVLDSACGLAAHTMLEEKQTLGTLEMKVSYHRAMNAWTGRVRATGRIVSMGRRTAFAEARLVDMNEQLLASATATLMVITSS